MLVGDDYQIARFVIERGLGAIYFVAFVVAARQFPALAGERGLEPAPQFLRRASFRDAPSIFHWRYTDRLLRLVAWSGAALAAAVVLGLAAWAPLPVTMLIWFVLWALYLSIMNIGGTFYSFGWESQLVETGFVAIFLGNGEIAPPLLTILLFRWIGFRVELGAGLIKLRGDACWRDLSCMYYHHETQPLPNPLSWLAHHEPRWMHRLEGLGNMVAQLVLPFGLFLPQPLATAAAVLLIMTQLYLVFTGNYSWLNWITILALVAGISDSTLRALLPGVPVGGALAPAPLWFDAMTVAFALLVGVLSYWPVRNLLSSRQQMNRSFDPFRLVNTYGAFGSVTRRRYEVIVEGTDDEQLGPDTAWREYEFKAKPGDPRRMPPQVAPYHLRLDWLMWFIPISPAYAGSWFSRLLLRLLEGDAPTLALLGDNPFPDRPPRFVRARLFHYRFSTWRELRSTGAWWQRSPAGELVGPLRMRAAASADVA
ncbi:MAG: lipase maturation factor family protein [Chloroflexota bacterium]|nr:lipase maturation factor family protein [Chloroflexota bacterium]